MFSNEEVKKPKKRLRYSALLPAELQAHVVSYLPDEELVKQGRINQVWDAHLKDALFQRESPEARKWQNNFLTHFTHSTSINNQLKFSHPDNMFGKRNISAQLRLNMIQYYWEHHKVISEGNYLFLIFIACNVSYFTQATSIWLNIMKHCLSPEKYWQCVKAVMTLMDDHFGPKHAAIANTILSLYHTLPTELADLYISKLEHAVKEKGAYTEEKAALTLGTLLPQLTPEQSQFIYQRLIKILSGLHWHISNHATQDIVKMVRCLPEKHQLELINGIKSQRHSLSEYELSHYIRMLANIYLGVGDAAKKIILQEAAYFNSAEFETSLECLLMAISDLSLMTDDAHWIESNIAKLKRDALAKTVWPKYVLQSLIKILNQKPEYKEACLDIIYHYHFHFYSNLIEYIKALKHIYLQFPEERGFSFNRMLEVCRTKISIQPYNWLTLSTHLVQESINAFVEIAPFLELHEFDELFEEIMKCSIHDDVHVRSKALEAFGEVLYLQNDAQLSRTYEILKETLERPFCRPWACYFDDNDKRAAVVSMGKMLTAGLLPFPDKAFELIIKFAVHPFKDNRFDIITALSAHPYQFSSVQSTRLLPLILEFIDYKFELKHHREVLTQLMVNLSLTPEQHSKLLNAMAKDFVKQNLYQNNQFMVLEALSAFAFQNRLESAFDVVQMMHQALQMDCEEYTHVFKCKPLVDLQYRLGLELKLLPERVSRSPEEGSEAMPKFKKPRLS